MRIGLNLLYLIPEVVGGTETYAAGLLDGLSKVGEGNEFLVYTNREAASWPIPERNFMRRIPCPVNATSRSARYFFEQARLPGLLREHSLDVIHSLGYVGPIRSPCPSVVTVHDLNFRNPELAMSYSKRRILGFFIDRSIRNAQRVITVSESSRAEIASHFRIPMDRIAAIHQAPDPRLGPSPDMEEVERFLADRGLRRPFLLAFGNRFPHKNIARLLEAFRVARSRGDTAHSLVITGHDFPGSSDVEAGVYRTGFLPASDLRKVLAAADFLVFPSLYEGFGLPVLEAMAAGVPVACSRRASLPEVAGDAALFFDPESVDEIAAAIGRLSRDRALREDLRKRGTENAARFSWEKTARETLEVYESVLASRG
jgi:glycosyltransferase involved in cell wall biosynthesis